MHFFFHTCSFLFQLLTGAASRYARYQKAVSHYHDTCFTFSILLISIRLASIPTTTMAAATYYHYYYYGLLIYYYRSTISIIWVFFFPFFF